MQVLRVIAAVLLGLTFAATGLLGLYGSWTLAPQLRDELVNVEDGCTYGSECTMAIADMRESLHLLRTSIAFCVAFPWAALLFALPYAWWYSRNESSDELYLRASSWKIAVVVTLVAVDTLYFIGMLMAYGAVSQLNMASAQDTSYSVDIDHCETEMSLHASQCMTGFLSLLCCSGVVGLLIGSVQGHAPVSTRVE